MNSKEFAKRLDILIDNFNREVVELVHEAQIEDGLDIMTDKPVSFVGDFEWQDVTDRIVLVGGWVFDRLNGRNRLSKRNITKKLRKVLGYTQP